MEQTYNIQANYNAYCWVEPAGSNSITLSQASYGSNDIYYSTDCQNWLPISYDNPVTVNQRVFINFGKKYVGESRGVLAITSGNYNIGGTIGNSRYGGPSEGPGTVRIAGDTKLISAKHLRIRSINAYSGLFDGCTNLVEAPDINITYTSNSEPYPDDIANFENMFRNCSSLVNPPTITIDFNNKTYKQVVNFNSMFNSCTSLISVPKIILKNRNLEKETTFPFIYKCSYMFAGCSNLETILDSFGPWHTNSNYMYSNCSKIKMSETQSSEYPNEWEAPWIANSSYNSDNMFYGTGGTFTGTPTNVGIYYTSNRIVNIKKE